MLQKFKLSPKLANLALQYIVDYYANYSGSQSNKIQSGAGKPCYKAVFLTKVGLMLMLPKIKTIRISC